MNKVLFFSVLIILSFPSLIYSQTMSAEDFLKEEMRNLLITEGVLLSKEDKEKSKVEGKWDNKFKRKKIIGYNDDLEVILLKQFRLPLYIKGKTVTINGVNNIPNKELSLLGSYIIRNSNITTSINDKLPNLPILDNGEQLSISPYNRATHYTLNMSTTKLFEFDGMSKIEGAYGEYFRQQLTTSIANKTKLR